MVSNPSDYLTIPAPDDLVVTLVTSATAEPAGFRVSWSNHSATADVATIECASVDGFVVRIGTTDVAGPFDDRDWPQWPGTRYRVREARTNVPATGGSTDWVAAPGFTLSSALVLDASAVPAPGGDGYALDSGGRIHVLRKIPFEGAVPSILRASADGWDTHALDGEIGVWVPPGLALDPDDHPHVAYVLAHPYDALTYTVRHVWYDGAAWQSEDLELNAAQTALAFAPASGGDAHLIVAQGAPGSTRLFHAERQEGAWSQTELPVPGFYVSRASLHAGADGALVLGVPDWNGFAFAVGTRPSGGTWALEQVTTDVTPFSASWFAGGDGGRAAMMFQRWVDGYVAFWAVRRDDQGGYSSPSLVASGPADGPYFTGALAFAADGSRTAFAVDLPDDGASRHEELFVRGATGGWHRMRIGPASPIRPDLRFTPAGKLRFLGEMPRSGPETGALPLLSER